MVEQRMSIGRREEASNVFGSFDENIRQIESEKTRYNFSVETLYKISVALDVSLDKFVE